MATASVVARAEQHGQSFSQLKLGETKGKEQTELVFDPQQQARSLNILTGLIQLTVGNSAVTALKISSAVL
jgi:hypothetical protein